MAKENISQELRSKEIDKIRNYFIKQIKYNELISKKHKQICKILNYTEYLSILASAGTGCVSVPDLPSLAGIPIGIASSAITKVSITTAGNKKYKSIIKKKKEKKFNTIEF